MTNKGLIAAWIIILACLAGVVATTPWAEMFNAIGENADRNELGKEACQETFGKEWAYSGYVVGTPPNVQCNGPNGETGVMDMPDKMQQELDIVVANHSEYNE